MRLRIAVIAAAVAASVATLAASPPSLAVGPLDSDGIPVWPGLALHQLSTRLGDGATAVANVLTFRADDQNLQLRPVLGQQQVPGLETVPSMGRRHLPAGAVAGTNGGFWLSNPVGDPNGYLAIGGQLVSEAQSQGGGPRGTLGVREDGAVLLDRLATTVSLFIAGVPGEVVTAVNRYCCGTFPTPDGDSPVYLYTPAFGESVAVRPLSATAPVRTLIVQGLEVAADGGGVGVVSAVTDQPGPQTLPGGSAIVVAHGAAAGRLAGVTAGDPVQTHTSLDPHNDDPAAWTNLLTGLAAGPLIVRGGRTTNPADWANEGFAPGVHADVRHPRSAIARLADGGVALLTVDGRQPGYSVGMTLHELAAFLLSLGAVDAISLDGGGSSQLAVDGLLRNRPCCDPTLRPVADGLFVYHSYEFTGTERLAGPDREATAAMIARASHPDGAGEALLASAADFPDALSGGPLASALDAPLLLTRPQTLSETTREALLRLDPETVTVLGGRHAISGDLEAQLRSQFPHVRRIAGEDRTATAAAVANELGSRHERLFVASAANFPDALAAAAPGGLYGLPVLLTQGTRLSEAARRVITEHGAGEALLVGGTAVLDERVAEELEALDVAVTRLAGPTRYAT
ncbi:MAG: phosphodiester glycosidase family protein, partial [Actinomycetota bacterium]|nr:phosphodiester glycosidase family protein [Actinomycetota bacterium]